MIEPTIGRIVWVWRRTGQSNPLPAIISDVISNNEITVCAFDVTGCPMAMPNVHLYQDGEIKPPNPWPYAEWMPYQKEQAAKTEALEKQVNKITYEKPDNQTHTFKE